MILVTGATGFLGKRVCHLLTAQGVAHRATSRSLGLDLTDARAAHAYFDEHRPSHVIHCAAHVGGIQFGLRHAADMFHVNMQMTLNLLAAAQQCKVQRIVNPISNCAYPAAATLFKEDEFWDGPLHESVLAYGMARKASWVGSWAYAKQYGLDVINLVLSNMYGPEDHFEEERSHALGALVMKFVRAKDTQAPEVVVWGSGTPVREWLHVDDGAAALVLGLSTAPYIQPINIGIGEGISILDIAKMIQQMVGYQGRIILDTSKADGAPFKTVDGTRGRTLLHWAPTRTLEEGVRETIDWYQSHKELLNGNH